MMKILEMDSSPTKISKVLKDLSLPILKELFNKRTLNHTLQHPSCFTIPRAESVFNGSASIARLVSKIWTMVLSDLKEMNQ